MIVNQPNRSRMATYPNDEEIFFNAESKPMYQTAIFTVSYRTGFNLAGPLECFVTNRRRVFLISYFAKMKNRFLDTMKPFNVMRLPEIKMLIYEAMHHNNKEIYDCFQCLVENIFDTEKPNNWNLIAQYDQQHHDEFNQLYSFLCAEGDLFNLIKYLMSDSSLKYLFPVSKLSVSSTRFNLILFV